MRLLLFLFIFPIVHSACPDGFYLYADGQCVQITPTKITNGRADQDVNNAITKCKETQAQPVIIHYEEQQSYWINQYKATNTFVLLGIICNTTTQKWQWPDGSPVDYKPSGQFPPNLNSNCVNTWSWFMVNGNGYWDYYIASAQPIHNRYCTMQLPPPGDLCDEDSADGVCYQVAKTAQNWQEAQMICRSFGADVSSVHNLQENSFLRRLAVSNGALNGIYLGATMSGKGNEFGWIDGSDWDYANFFPGFPMAGMGDCLVMDTDGTSGQWANVDCSAQLSVACTRSQNYTSPICSTGPWKEGQIIASPGYPYDATTPCDYLLEVDAGKKVELEIILMEANSCCDYLTVIENYFGGNFIANLTGAVDRKIITTTSSNFMRVSWQPNGAVNVKGLMMSFRGV